MLSNIGLITAGQMGPSAGSACTTLTRILKGDGTELNFGRIHLWACKGLTNLVRVGIDSMANTIVTQMSLNACNAATCYSARIRD